MMPVDRVAPSSAPVLLVEDDEASQRAVQWVLELGGYATVTASSGSEALGYLLAGALPLPSLIVLDLKLPDMTGDVLYGVLRAQPQLSEIPVVVFTGHPDIPPLPGVAGTVIKGSHPDVLLRHVDAACGHSRDHR